MLKSKTFYQGFCVLTLMLHANFAQQTCKTQYNSIGECVPHEECSYVEEHLKIYKQRNYDVSSYFRAYRGRCDGKIGKIICCVSEYVIKTPVITTSTTTTTEKSITHVSCSAENYNNMGFAILSQQNCGPFNSNRVAHGEDVKLAEFPWMAALRYGLRGQYATCAGSLITNRFILTAAHCVHDLDVIGVKLGAHNLERKQVCAGTGAEKLCTVTENHKIERIIEHANYSAARKAYDIALIKLQNFVQIKRAIKPICLPIRESQLIMADQQPLKIAGWGQTETGQLSSKLQKATLSYVNEDKCKQIFFIDYIKEIHFCYAHKGNANSCRGDSGSPIFMLKKNQYTQYAIVSQGTQKCGGYKKYPSLATNVIGLMPWIQTKIGENL